MESILDIIINPRGAVAGAAVVDSELKKIGASAQTMSEKVNAKFASMKSAIFSVQSALATLGIGLVVRDTVDLALSLERAERGLRAVTISAQAAHIQLERIRKIGDEFQLFDDQSLANAFRLLASNGVENAEDALRTIANTAAATGVEVETVTMAVMSGMERPLRQIGVSVADLGSQTAFTFGNMTVYADKTDKSIRQGLLTLLGKSMPDAARQMQNSMEFNFKRVQDRVQDLQAAIMRGGVQQAITSLFRGLGDAVSDQDIEDIGRKMADGILRGLKTITVGTAVIIDAVLPLGRLLFEVADRAFKLFSGLPPEIQTVGLFGFLMFGTSGRAAIIGGLALMDVLGVKSEDLAKGIKSVSEEAINLAASSPLGVLMAKGLELKTGKPVTSRPDHVSDETLYLGTGKRMEVPDFTKPPEGVQSAQSSVKAYWEDLETSIKKALEASKHFNEETKKGAAGSSGLIKKNVFNEAYEKANATLQVLQQQIEITNRLERQKFRTDSGVDLPEDALTLERIRKEEEFKLKLAEKNIVLKDEQQKRLTTILDSELKIKRENERQVLLQEQRSNQAQAFVALQVKTGDAVRDVSDELDLMLVPLGLARRGEEIRLGLTREIQKAGARLTAERANEIQLLLKQAEVLAHQQFLVVQRKKAETDQVSAAREILTLEQKIRDARSGRTTPSLQSRVESRVADLTAVGGGRAPDQDTVTTVALQEQLRMRKEVSVSAELSAQATRLETQNLSELNMVMGGTRAERELELRIIEEKQRLQASGDKLSEEEIQNLRKVQTGLQQQKNLSRQTSAVNNFFNSMEVGWEQVGQTATTAANRMTDALTEFAMTGKANFAEFANAVIADIMRMMIRMLLFKAIEAGFSAVSGAYAVSHSRNVSGVNVAAGTGYAEGGVADFGRESLVKLHGKEAIVPLSGGRSIPVSLRDTSPRPLKDWSASTVKPVATSMPVTIHNYASNDTKVEARQSQTSSGQPQLEVMVSKLMDKAIVRGRFDKTMRSRFGLTPGER